MDTSTNDNMAISYIVKPYYGNIILCWILSPIETWRWGLIYLGAKNNGWDLWCWEKTQKKQEQFSRLILIQTHPCVKIASYRDLIQVN